MITPTLNDEDVEEFKTLFSGYTEAHGTFEIKTTGPQTEKKSGKALTILNTPTTSLWQGHLAGAPRGLGVIPLLDDGESVKWAAIDIDVNDIDHASLEKKVEDLGLPLVVCRSKSGGAHCYLFLQMPCPAKDVVDALRNWSAALGHPGVEIFPKQTERELDPQTGNPRPGNWINLPYFSAKKTERYCIRNGSSLPLGEFLTFAQSNRASAAQLLFRCPIEDHPAERAPSSKAREGRNGFLYSKGCNLRAEGADEEEMRLSLVELNQAATEKDHPNFSNGPITASEIDQVISSIVKHIPAGTNQEEAGLIRELNEKHAVVMIGGKCVIANEQFDPTFGHKNLTFSSPPDLVARYSNRFVGRGKNKTTAGKAWLSHPERRQYEGMVFAPGQNVPGYLNMDRGFAVEPTKGDCSRFLEHIRNNICSADEDLSDYLLAWMADSVQNRAQRPGISVVLRGRQGTGKGVLVNQFGSLFGQHFIQISQASHLTGNFNSHLKDKLIVYADEAFWAGDKKGEGVLKALITEGTIQIEMKGKDVLTFKNYIRLIISSNNDWVIPAGNDERRFFVIDVGEARIQDRAYFGGVIDQMNSGGREALLQYLLDYDLNGISLGSPPSTKALSDQKHHSSSYIQKWWFERLMEGHIISDSSNWKPNIRSNELHRDYLSIVQDIGSKRRLPSSVFGKELKKLMPGVERVRVTSGKSRHWFYQIPDLEHCRRHYDLITKHTWEWPEED